MAAGPDPALLALLATPKFVKNPPSPNDYAGPTSASDPNSAVKIKQFAPPPPDSPFGPTYGVKDGKVVTESSSDTQQPISSLQALLSAILGGSQGQVPQGYANFFTQVLGPMMEQQAKQNSQQLASIPGVNPNVLANLNAMNQATQVTAGPGAQALQEFTLGPLANTQKLIQTLTNALSFIPYSASGIGSTPPYAADILSLLGLNLPSTSITGAGATNPTGAVTGTAPKLPY